MARVKRGNVLRKRHKKILKLAKGFRGGRGKLFHMANQAVMKALTHQYKDRRNKKRTFRQLWILRINAATRLNGISYSAFIDGSNKANIILNRKMLADIAIKDPAAFTKITELVKQTLQEEANVTKKSA